MIGVHEEHIDRTTIPSSASFRRLGLLTRHVSKAITQRLRVAKSVLRFGEKSVVLAHSACAHFHDRFVAVYGMYVFTSKSKNYRREAEISSDINGLLSVASETVNRVAPSVMHKPLW